MSGLVLQQQQRLQMHLSPAQIQAVKMIELPAMEMQQRVNEELQDNPALEEGPDPEEQQAQESTSEELEGEDEYENPLQNDEFNYDDYIEDDETPDYKLRSNNYSDDAERNEVPLIGGTSFTEYLKSQVYLTHMTKPERHIAKWVLGNIDDDGYLRRSIEQLVDDLSFQEGLVVPDEQMAAIVEQIKQFDPPGVASSNLQECLIVQLKVKEQTDSVVTAITILQNCFEDFAKRHFDKVALKLNITDEQLKGAIDEITRLNQKPANAFAGYNTEQTTQTIIPDFYVEEQDGQLIVTTNTGDVPQLHVSREYNELLKTYSEQAHPSKDMEETVKFIRTKIDSARSFIDAIRQRYDTLSRTMQAIVEYQKEFFLQGGEISLRPMILQDIADMTGYDVSTISRVSNSKYVQTEFGMFPLKHFFSEAMTNVEGDEISSRETKKALQELISQEDKRHPFSDDALVKKMKDSGYIIARRTIAKYREQMNIPVARLRKQA